MQIPFRLKLSDITSKFDIFSMLVILDKQTVFPINRRVYYLFLYKMSHV
jgi:hypothetical protein